VSRQKVNPIADLEKNAIFTRGSPGERFLPTSFHSLVEMTGHQALGSRKLGGYHDHFIFPQIVMTVQFSAFFAQMICHSDRREGLHRLIL